MSHPLYNTTGLQKDNKSHVMYALANKQMELKQLEDEYKVKINKIKSDLVAMEQVICLFDENCTETLDKINKKNQNTRIVTKSGEHRFARGELGKLILTQLRISTKPLTINEVHDKIKTLMKYDFDFKTNVKDGLKTLSNKGITEVAESIGRNNAYKIKD